MNLSGVSPTQMALLVGGGFGVLAGIAALVMPDSHGRVRARLEALKPPSPEPETVSVFGVEQFGALGKWIAASPMVGVKEQGKMAELLAGAGISGRDKLAAFIAAKASLAVGLAVVVSVVLFQFGILQQRLPLRLTVILGGALLGWRLPDIVVGRMAKKRRSRLRDGVADALDLLIICAEAGLGLEQAMDRVSRDIKVANPIIAEEFATTVAEMRVLPQMRDAFDNFAKRSGLPVIKSVVTTLVQSIQYGTPLSQSLRVLSAEMRQRRILEIEERAARLPVLLTVPLILFILPCLFLIVAGPAVMQVVVMFK